MNKHGKEIFLTGATGFLGSYLLKLFLDNDHKVFALARSKYGMDAKSRIIKTLGFWDKTVLKKINNLEIIEGSICKKNLGISKTTSTRLSKHVNEIFHAAALTELNVPFKHIRDVNVRGTKNVLDMALTWNKNNSFKKVNHISTAYVYGDYKKIFKENNLNKNQKFHTNYERSKFESEKLILQYRKKGLWIDIFRPPMILGESTTGKTFQFKHIYQFLKLCELELFHSLPLAQGSVCLVPIDVTSRAIYLLDKFCTNRNSTYHPFPNKLISIATIIKIGAKILGFKPPQLIKPTNCSSLKLTPVQLMLLNNPAFTINFEPGINSEMTNRILKKYHYSIPFVGNKILSIMLQYYSTRNKGIIK
ncbi:MAG: SDR family oxidoreductase [Candidatus Omnitrophica bacterium]|nr:SDR family oxidoreductase [Candidatus Omnitrophota bacterium]